MILDVNGLDELSNVFLINYPLFASLLHRFLLLDSHGFDLGKTRGYLSGYWCIMLAIIGNSISQTATLIFNFLFALLIVLIKHAVFDYSLEPLVEEQNLHLVPFRYLSFELVVWEVLGPNLGVKVYG